MLTEVKTRSNDFETALIMRFGDRYQSVCFRKNENKKDTVRLLHELAEEIARDELIE